MSLYGPCDGYIERIAVGLTSKRNKGYTDVGYTEMLYGMICFGVGYISKKRGEHMEKKRQRGRLSNDQIQARRDELTRAKQVRLDKTRLALVYSRQSTKKQTVVNIESALSQRDDMIAYAMHTYTWPEEKIKLFIENMLDKWGNKLDKPRAASGTLDMIFRPGLSEVERFVKADKAGAIFVDGVSRLFRDEDMIDPPRFAKACKDHNVVIITYDQEFDFNATGRDDMKAFREEAEDAAEELKILRRVRLRRREKKGLRGGYTGHPLPTGFMLYDKHSEYVPNPLWAPVVAWLTRRYRELDADITALHKEIYATAIFPELPDDIKKYVGRIQLQPVSGGYTVASRASLVALLINPVNIGHKRYKGEIVKWDAHPPIVNKDDFAFAVAHLDTVDLDGNKIEREKRVARYTHGQRREGLLAGVRANGRPVVTSTQGGVYVFQQGGFAAYTIKDMHYNGEYSGSISLDIVDAAVSQRLEDKLHDLLYHAEESENRIEAVNELEVMSDKPEAQAWGREIKEKVIASVREEQASARAILDHMAALKQQVVGSLKKIDESIADIENKIAFKQHEYEVAKGVMSDEDIKEHYASLARLRSRLADLREKQEQAAQVDREIETVKSRLERAREEWEEWTLEQRRSFIRLISQDIVLDNLTDRLLKLTIVWSPVLGENPAEYTLLVRGKGSGADWTEEEDGLLRQMYPLAVRSDILAALPRRSWVACKSRAKALDIRRFTYESGDVHVPDGLALEDWIVMSELGVEPGEWALDAAVKGDGSPLRATVRVQ